MVMGSKSIGRVSQVLVGEKSPGKKGIIPTAVMGTGVFVTLQALDSAILGSRLNSIGVNIPGTTTRFSIIDGINFLIFFSGKGRLKSGVTAVVGSKLITGAVSIAGLVPGLGGGLPSGIAAAGGSSGVAAGSSGAPV